MMGDDIVGRLDAMAHYNPYLRWSARPISCPDGHAWAEELGSVDIEPFYSDHSTPASVWHCLGCGNMFSVPEGGTAFWGGIGPFRG